MMRRIAMAALLFAAPASSKECPIKEQMLLKVEYEGSVQMVDEAKAAAARAQAAVAEAAAQAKAKPPVLKSSRLSLAPGKGGMEYRGSGSYVLGSTLGAKDLLANLAERKLSPSITLSTTSSCRKDD